MLLGAVAGCRNSYKMWLQLIRRRGVFSGVEEAIRRRLMNLSLGGLGGFWGLV
jgi:hypothetical protein